MNSTLDGRRQLRWLLVPVLFVVAVAAIAIAVSAYYREATPQNYGWWPLAPFGWFFFIPLIFVGFFLLRFFLWGSWGGPGWSYGEDSAMLVLRERFARSELTKEQFEQMKKDLSQRR